MTRWLDDAADRIVSVLEGLAAIYLYATHQRDTPENEAHVVDVRAEAEGG